MHPSFTPRRSPRLPRSCYRILLKQARDHGRVQVRTNAHDGSGAKIDHPAIAIVEPHSVLCGCQRVKLDHCLIVLNKHVLCLQLDTLQKHAIQLSERAIDECLRAELMTSQGVCALHDPVHIICHMFEETGTVARFKFLEYCANLVFCNSHLNLSLLLQSCVLWFVTLISVVMAALSLP